MKSKHVVRLSATLVGKMVEDQVGLIKLTNDFNSYRKSYDLSPVNMITVRRYNNGGSGYERTPKNYRKFIAEYVGLV